MPLACARNPQANLDIVQRICDLLDGHQENRAPHSDLIAHVADRPAHDVRYVSNPAKIEDELGWKPQIEFDDGFAETVNWYLQNGDWCTQTSQRYDRHRLGLGHQGS